MVNYMTTNSNEGQSKSFHFAFIDYGNFGLTTIRLQN